MEKMFWGAPEAVAASGKSLFQIKKSSSIKKKSKKIKKNLNFGKKKIIWSI